MARNHVWRYTLRLFHTFAIFEKNRKIDAKREAKSHCRRRALTAAPQGDRRIKISGVGIWESAETANQQKLYRKRCPKRSRCDQKGYLNRYKIDEKSRSGARCVRGASWEASGGQNARKPSSIWDHFWAPFWCKNQKIASKKASKNRCRKRVENK